MSDEEKPLDLRDKLALEILNGLLSHSKNDVGSLIRDIVYHLNYDGEGPAAVVTREQAAERIEEVVRSCYKVADIMRRVRLTAFT